MAANDRLSLQIAEVYAVSRLGSGARRRSLDIHIHILLHVNAASKNEPGHQHENQDHQHGDGDPPPTAPTVALNLYVGHTNLLTRAFCRVRATRVRDSRRLSRAA